MILDKQNLLSDGQTLIAAAGSFYSTNAIDLDGGIAGGGGANGFTTDSLGHTPKSSYHAGKSPRLTLWAQITTTYLAAGGASTVTFEVVQSANANLSSHTVLSSSGAIAKATLVAGYRITLPGPYIPFSARYLGLQITIATNDGTAGAFSAGIVLDAQSNF